MIKDTEQLRKLIEESAANKTYQKGYEIFQNAKSEAELQEAIDLIQDAAIDGCIEAMYAMAWLCHDDRKGLNTQCRSQELFWYEQTYNHLDGGRMLYHAQNMIERSYDRGFAKEEIDKVLKISAALGNAQAKKYLLKNG